jgi:mannan endo-1,4-beta-mannosidase
MNLRKEIQTMNIRQITLWLLTGLLCIGASSVFGSEGTIEPVTPNASREAKALLQLLHSISGKYTLTGQHNYPNTKDASTQQAAEYSGKTPAVYSQDWGFAKDGDKDSYLARPDIVEEVKRQHKLGSIITICWHAVPPTADEPITFRPKRGEPAPDKLATVQGQLTDEQFKDVLTPGTELYKRWCAQVDTIAVYLKQLQDANVPVLWRPYHEMNGEWFWWGGRRGEYSTKALYRQLFNRYVNHHKLTNLIWVWSVDRPSTPRRQFADYFPGSEYLDIVSLDVYGSDFNQSYYDGLLKLADGKPLVLGEVGNPPSLEVLQKQPMWTLYVIWAEMVRFTRQQVLQTLVNDPRMLSLEDPAYHKVIAPFRIACGLPLLRHTEPQPIQ